MNPQRVTTKVLWLVPVALGVLSLGRATDLPTSAAVEVVRVWPGTPPGERVSSSGEVVEEPGTLDEKITDVTVPTLTVFRPTPGRATGAAMIILPGGGFNSLAWEREGILVAHWLTDRGITAFLLKYRVTSLNLATKVKMGAMLLMRRPTMFRDLMAMVEPGRRIAIEDGLQAIRVVRSNAQKYEISSDRIGMMGFSAGAITTIGVVLEGDPASRPNFAATLYGSALNEKEPSKNAPPLFIVHCVDDPIIPVSESLNIFQAWQKVGIPAALHVYPTGVHGFGMRPVSGTAAVAWPQAFEAWLRQQGAIQAEPVLATK
jgi:acetyl esterase/lipase